MFGLALGFVEDVVGGGGGAGDGGGNGVASGFKLLGRTWLAAATILGVAMVAVVIVVKVVLGLA